MKGDYQSPVYQLFLGYTYYRLYEYSRQGFKSDRDLGALAHKHLMLAYDLGRNNRRVKASALSDLELLQMALGNWGLARRFFELRFKLNFVNDEQELAQRWHFSRDLYFLADYDKAADQLRMALKLQAAQSTSYQLVLLQRLGFYQVQAGDFEAAQKNLEKYLNYSEEDSLWNRARAHLDLGYALLKQGKTKTTSAKKRVLKEFEDCIAMSSRLKPKEVGGDRVVSLRPLRIKILALGFKSQVVEGTELIKTLQEYYESLSAAEGDLVELSMKKENQMAALMKTQARLAEAYLKQKELASSRRSLVHLAKLIQDYIGDFDVNYNSQLVRGMLSFCGLALLANSRGSELEGVLESISKVVEQSLKIQGRTPEVNLQIASLKAYAYAVNSRLLHKATSADLQSVQSFLKQISSPQIDPQLQKLAGLLR